MSGRSALASGVSLRKEILVYGAATFAERISSFLLLPLLTKTLPQDLYGVWSQVVVSIALATTIILLGLQTAAVRFLVGTDRESERRIVTGMLALVVTTAGVAGLAALLLARPLSVVMFGSPRFEVYARVVGLLWAGEALFELLVAILRARRRIDKLSIYYLIKNIFRLGVLAVALLVLNMDLLTALLAYGTVQLIFVAVIYARDIPLEMDFPRLRREDRWVEIAEFALPLVPYGLLTWANNFLDRYLVIHLLDLRQVSMYAAAYSLAAIGGLFYAVLGFVLYPHLVERWNRGDRSGTGAVLRSATGYYLLLLTPFVAILTILNGPIIRVFATEAYLAGWPVLLLLALGVGLFGFYQLHLYSTLLAGKMRENFVILTAAMVTNLAVNLALIPPLGILGAAVATVISNGILAGATIAVGKAAAPYIFPWQLVVRVAFAGLVMSGFLLIARATVNVGSVWGLALVVAAAAAIYASANWFGRAILADGS